MSKWTVVFTDEVLHRAEIVKDVLFDNDIPAVLINKKDSAYQFGVCEVSVEQENVLKAIKIIEDDIKFG